MKTCEKCKWKPPTMTVLDRDVGLVFLCDTCVPGVCERCNMDDDSCECVVARNPILRLDQEISDQVRSMMSQRSRLDPRLVEGIVFKLIEMALEREMSHYVEF